MKEEIRRIQMTSAKFKKYQEFKTSSENPALIRDRQRRSRQSHPIKASRSRGKETRYSQNPAVLHFIAMRGEVFRIGRS